MTSCVHRTIRGALLKILWHIKKTFVAKNVKIVFAPKKIRYYGWNYKKKTTVSHLEHTLSVRFSARRVSKYRTLSS